MSDGVAPLLVAVLGHGAIGAVVARALAAGQVPGAELVGIVARGDGDGDGDGDGKHSTNTNTNTNRVLPHKRSQPHNHPILSLDEALTKADVIVECAGGDAVRQHGPAVIAAGRTLLVVSVGALADPQLRQTLLHDGPGVCLLSTGAVGGLDLLRAASRDGGIQSAALTSTKRAATLVQPWMSAEEAERLRSTDEAFTLFEGGIDDAIRFFPASLNVGVALAAATGLWNETCISLVADPEATLTTHEIAAAGAAGSYAFTITNRPLPDNPTSSGVVASALLRGIADLARPSGAFL